LHYDFVVRVWLPSLIRSLARLLCVGSFARSLFVRWSFVDSLFVVASSLLRRPFVVPSLIVCSSLLRRCSSLLRRPFAVPSPFLRRSFAVPSPFLRRSFAVPSPFVAASLLHRWFAVPSPLLASPIFTFHSPTQSVNYLNVHCCTAMTPRWQSAAAFIQPLSSKKQGTEMH